MRAFSRLAPIALLAALSAACGASTSPSTTATTPPPTTTMTATPTATPEPRTEKWVVFERKYGDDYYRVDTLGFFRRRLSDGKEEKLAISPAERAWFASPDGRQVAVVEGRGDATRLLVAPADNLVAMREIAKAKGLMSVVWSADGRQIFFTTAVPGDNHEPPATGVETIDVVDADGSNRRRIASFDYFGAYAYRDLLTHDAKNGNVLWTRGTHEGAGSSNDLYATSVARGTTRKVVSFTAVYAGRTAITPDGSFVYYVKNDTKLLELRTSDGRERVVYEVDGRKENTIENVFVTGDGERLVFRGNREGSVGSSGKVENRSATTYIVRLEDGTRSTAFADTDGRFFISPSSDGAYLWLMDGGHKEESTELLEVATGRRTVIARPMEGKPTVAKLIGWLNVAA